MVDRRRRVVWSDAALRALEEAATYVAADAPDAARRLVERVLTAADSLQLLATRGRTVPELSKPGVRELLVRPFRLIYQVQGAEVQILALLHQARDFDRWSGGSEQ